jgi:hypothetical protein
MKERFGRKQKGSRIKAKTIRTNFFSMETQNVRKEKLSSRFKKPICVG